MKIDISLFIVKGNISIIDVIKKIDSNGSGIVFIVDNENKLIGSITDGDIRRLIIRTGSIDCDVKDIYNRNPKYLRIEKRNEAIDYMIKEHVRVIPLVNEELNILDIVFNAYNNDSELKQKNTLHKVSTIVMAGGKGSRLYPYTKILPKPLIPIGNVPILERILDRFVNFGVSDFYITVNYKKEMIKSYFSEIRHSYSITYIEEDKPLGTAGSLKLIKKKFDMPVFVSNCDILIDADYDRIYNYHIKSNNDITVVSSLKVTTIPYGVFKTKEDGIIVSLEEKPKLSHFINTGLYVVSPESIKLIPDDVVFDMTQLLEFMISKGKKVGMYPISENAFLDMGEFSELKKMEERINGEYIK